MNAEGEGQSSDKTQGAPVGGRVFFSNVRRSLEIEDEILLISVGVDIGSSTSHLVFSRLLLERLDNRYVVSKREIVHESDVLLTPYAADQSIDAAALRVFIDAQYDMARVDPRAIDTGALILTGVAVRRSNARKRRKIFDKLPCPPAATAQACFGKVREPFHTSRVRASDSPRHAAPRALAGAEAPQRRDEEDAPRRARRQHPLLARRRGGVRECLAT